jgi:hypothetical protein
MKTIFFTVIVAVFIICPATLQAQTDHRQSRGNGNRGVVVNNYYSNHDYDYFYSSRINRFHRSYATFNYYSPVFTESYWYNPMPFTWGISIYGAGGFGGRYYYNYPGSYFDLEFYNGYDPFIGGSYFWGYDPFFYNPWYSPFFINIGYRSRWNNHYYGWRDERNNHRYDDYGWNNTNRSRYREYPSPRHSSGYLSTDNPHERRSGYITDSHSGNISRRSAVIENNTRSNAGYRRSPVQSNARSNSSGRASGSRSFSSGNRQGMHR